jgi:hypothetical protein
MHPLGKIHRAYTAIKAAVIALVMIGFGAAVSLVAVPILRLGLAWFDWTGDFTSSWNVMAIALVILGLIAIGYGINKIFEALPWITPRRTSTAPGASRLANRRDLYRSRIIR